MLGLRWTIEAQPRSKNGRPHQATTGVASASSIHPAARGDIQRCTGSPRSGPMAMTRSGIVSAAPTFRRRLKSTSSGLGPASAGRHALGLERHAADRADARALLHDLGMHGAGVERAGGLGLRVGCLRVEIALRIGDELLAAARTAEVLAHAGVLVRVPGRRHGDRHAADGIDGCCRLGRRRLRRGVAGMRVGHAMSYRGLSPVSSGPRAPALRPAPRPAGPSPSRSGRVCA